MSRRRNSATAPSATATAPAATHGETPSSPPSPSFARSMRRPGVAPPPPAPWPCPWPSGIGAPGAGAGSVWPPARPPRSLPPSVAGAVAAPPALGLCSISAPTPGVASLARGRRRGTAAIGSGLRSSAISACAVTQTGVWRLVEE